MSILVVHDTPVKSGHHLKILDSIIKACGETYEIVNVVPQMPDKELKKLKPEVWLAEQERILKASKKHKKILACGTLAAATVFGTEKSVAVTKVRGRGYLAPNGVYCIPTYSPSTVVKDSDFFRDLVFDIEKLCSHKAPMEVPEVDIQLCETRDDLKLLDDLHSASFIGMDIETTGFGIHAVPLSIGFGVLTEDNTGYVVVVPQALIGREVKKFLTTYEGVSVWHNLKFDIQHLWRKFGHFKMKNPVDTMLMNYMADERPFNRYRSHALKLMARVHFDAPQYDLDMGKWLEEYLRKSPRKADVSAWIEQFCDEHPETARRQWREGYEEEFGEEPEWRGLKVGRDISVEVVAPYIKLPKNLLPAPTKERKGEMLTDLHTYQGLDCYYTAALYPLMKKRLDEESPRLFPLHLRYVKCSLAFARMESNGAPIDRPYFETMRAHLIETLELELEQLREIVFDLTGLNEFGKTNPGPFNPNSSDQVKKVLYEEEGLALEQPRDAGRNAYKRDAGHVTTDKDVLKVLAKQVAKERPVVADLIKRILQYRIRTKILGTYVDGILDRCDSDGRVRGDFNLHGTATGRTSCSNPNLQNIPDSSHVGYDIRKGYVASPGHVLLEADYSQLELRVAALFSQDPVLLDVYRNGGDIHQEVAYMLWQKPKDEVTKYERYLAKCMNFGVIYGRGGRSIATGPEMDNLREISGKSWSVTEIETYFNKFKVGYKVLFNWMTLVKEDSLAKQHVENPLGFRRRFDCIFDKERSHVERQSVNSPIQGFAGQLMVIAITEMDEQLDWDRCKILFTVHDSVVLEAERSYAKQAAEIVRHCMEDMLPEAFVTLPQLDHSPFTDEEVFDYNLPFVADVNIGLNWGECYDSAENWKPYVAEGEEEIILAR